GRFFFLRFFFFPPATTGDRHRKDPGCQRVHTQSCFPHEAVPPIRLQILTFSLSQKSFVIYLDFRRGVQLPAQKTCGLYKTQYQILPRRFVAAAPSRFFRAVTGTFMAALNTNPLLPCSTRTAA